MGKMIVKEKSVVVPGEEVAEGMDMLPGLGTYREGEKIVSSLLGLAILDRRAVKIIPLSGRYLPKTGDMIVGKVIDISMNGWRIETNSAYSAMLPLRDATSEYIAKGADLTHWFNIGDYMMAKITNVTSQRLVDLTLKGPGLRKLRGGRIVTVNPNKVPRIIGKQGSMVSMLKQEMNCKVTVGQNGVVWIEGTPENELLVVEVIKKIERESHLSGLTEKIKEFITKNNKNIKGE